MQGWERWFTPDEDIVEIEEEEEEKEWKEFEGEKVKEGFEERG